jgi:hypothetical protein
MVIVAPVRLAAGVTGTFTVVLWLAARLWLALTSVTTVAPFDWVDCDWMLQPAGNCAVLIAIPAGRLIENESGAVEAALPTF